ncbi:hypothetical protein C8241_06515, partial [Paracidovorax avenae]
MRMASTPLSTPNSRRPGWKLWLPWTIAAVVALSAAFALYAEPGFVVMRAKSRRSWTSSPTKCSSKPTNGYA